eukprot:gene3442-23208_t
MRAGKEVVQAAVDTAGIITSHLARYELELARELIDSTEADALPEELEA